MCHKPAHKFSFAISSACRSYTHLRHSYTCSYSSTVTNWYFSSGFLCPFLCFLLNNNANRMDLLLLLLLRLLLLLLLKNSKVTLDCFFFSVTKPYKITYPADIQYNARFGTDENRFLSEHIKIRINNICLKELCMHLTPKFCATTTPYLKMSSE